MSVKFLFPKGTTLDEIIWAQKLCFTGHYVHNMFFYLIMHHVAEEIDSVFANGLTLVGSYYIVLESYYKRFSNDTTLD